MRLSFAAAAEQIAKFAFQYVGRFAGQCIQTALHAAGQKRIDVTCDWPGQSALQGVDNDFNRFPGILGADPGFLHNEIN